MNKRNPWTELLQDYMKNRPIEARPIGYFTVKEIKEQIGMSLTYTQGWIKLMHESGRALKTTIVVSLKGKRFRVPAYKIAEKHLRK